MKAKGASRNRAAVFRRNLRQLLAVNWLSQREAADEIRVPYKWLRRLCHQGLERTDRRTRTNLARLARFFEVNSESLWDEKLISAALPKSDWVLIKWTGSKRRQAAEILKHFPQEIDTYYEPFVGGGAVLHRLLSSDIRVGRIRCSDICPPLIDLWNLIKDDPRTLVRGYEGMWCGLRDGGKDFYYRARETFNRTGNPCEFFFLLRTCRNGLVRFNKRGQFTAAFHHQRSGLSPEKLGPVLADWNQRLRAHDIRFTVGSYDEIRSKGQDFLYLDPPYAPAKDVYFGKIDFGDFFRWLEQQRGAYVLSLNGFVGDKDCRVSVPEWHYDEHLQLVAGASPYRRLDGREAPLVTDSLYVRRSELGGGASWSATG